MGENMDDNNLTGWRKYYEKEIVTKIEQKVEPKADLTKYIEVKKFKDLRGWRIPKIREIKEIIEKNKGEILFNGEFKWCDFFNIYIIFTIIIFICFEIPFFINLKEEDAENFWRIFMEPDHLNYLFGSLMVFLFVISCILGDKLKKKRIKEVESDEIEVLDIKIYDYEYRKIRNTKEMYIRVKTDKEKCLEWIKTDSSKNWIYDINNLEKDKYLCVRYKYNGSIEIIKLENYIYWN